MADGQPKGDCVVGFDRASWVIVAVADAPNYWILVRHGTTQRTIDAFGLSYFTGQRDE
jgi:hypothetical protein